MFQKMKKMVHRMKIKDVVTLDQLSDVASTFFNVLTNETAYPLVKDFINSDNVEDINWDYFGSHSADKYISPIYEKFIATKDQPNGFIADMIYRRFGEKWKKIYDALMTEYKPLENYSMVEERTPDLEFTETEKHKSTTERETTATSSYKGFNAVEPVTITKTDGSEDVTTSGIKADNEKTTTHKGSETLTRSGNIGVTTSQQMLESELKIRQFDFYKQVYNDIDSILCLSIY